jgi:hypothetical protein
MLGPIQFPLSPPRASAAGLPEGARIRAADAIGRGTSAGTHQEFGLALEAGADSDGASSDGHPGDRALNRNHLH